MVTRFSYGAAVLFPLMLVSCAHTSPPPPGQSVWFVEPKDGATVTNPFKVVFGVGGMAVASAGEIKPDAGHHHLLINLDAIPAGESIPVNTWHMHFGKGQTETELRLPPGTYKLTMQFANGAHVSYGPAMAATINISVK